jgi:TP901 family phage tail tape measure protein
MSAFGVLAKMGMDATEMKKGISSIKDKMKDFGSKIGTFVVNGAKVAGAAILGFTIKGAKDVADFDNKMQEVFTLMPGITDDAMSSMKASMRSLADTMGIDLLDSVNALYQAISAGIPAESAVNFIGEAAKLSVAGVSSLEDAVASITTVLNGYGLGAEDATKVSDVLFSTVKAGVTTLTELGGEIGKVTPIAASLGVSFEEVGAMFATMTKQLGAGKTAEAGTAIQSMLAELSKDTSLASRNFKELTGTSFPNFIKEGGSVTDALRLMSDEAEANDTSLRNMFSGIKAGQAALMLMTDNGDAMSMAFTQMKDDAGSVEKGFETMEQSVGRQFAKMQSAVHELGMQMGEAILPIANQIIPTLTTAFRNAMPTVQKFANEFPAIMNNVVSMGDALVDVGIVIASYVVATKGATAVQGAFKASMLASGGAIKGFKGAMKALAGAVALNPFALLIAGATALGLAIKGLIDMEKDREEALRLAGEAHRKRTAQQNQEYVSEIEMLEARFKSAKNALADLNAEKEKGSDVKQGRDAIADAEEELRLMKLKLEQRKKFDSTRALSEEEYKKKKLEIIAKVKEEAAEHASVEQIQKSINAELLIITRKMTEQKELEVAIKKKAEEVKDMKADQAKIEADILQTQKDVEKVLDDVGVKHKLNNTEIGKLVLKSQDLKQLELDKKNLIDKNIGARALEKGAANDLKDVEEKILQTRQDILNMLEGALKDARNAELKQVQDLVAELEKALQAEKDLAKEAGDNADKKEREVAALRDELKAAEESLEPLKKFFQKDFKGQITPNYSEMHREFKKLKEEGKLPDNVETLRDFEQLVTDQAAAAKTHRDGIIEAGKTAMADAQELRDLENEHLKKVETIQNELDTAKENLIDKEDAVLDKAKKTAEELAHETMAIEQAIAKFTDTLNTNPPLVPETIAEALNGQMEDLNSIDNNISALLQKDFGYGTLDEDANREATQKKIKDSMEEAVDYLAGFFINQ